MAHVALNHCMRNEILDFAMERIEYSSYLNEYEMFGGATPPYCDADFLYRHVVLPSIPQWKLDWMAELEELKAKDLKLYQEKAHCIYMKRSMITGAVMTPEGPLYASYKNHLRVTMPENIGIPMSTSYSTEDFVIEPGSDAFDVVHVMYRQLRINRGEAQGLMTALDKFLNRRRTCGQVRRDWPGLFRHMPSQLREKLGDTVAKGPRDCEVSEPVRERIEYLLTMGGMAKGAKVPGIAAEGLLKFGRDYLGGREYTPKT